MNDPVRRYTPVAMLLHWLIAVAIVTIASLGLYMSGLPLSPWRVHLYGWHKWAGVTVFLLLLVRLGWRATHAPPPLPDSIGAHARRAAAMGHALLYVLMFAVPLSGWLMSSARGFQTVYFGILPIPDLMPRDKHLGEVLLRVHQALNLLLAVTVTGHVAAALRHHVVARNGVLASMLPWGGRR